MGVYREDPLPGPDEKVAIIPSVSPSMHSLKVFDHNHEAVQAVTRDEAETAGFTPCVRCWADVEAGTPKSLDDLGKGEKETGDE